MGWARKKAGKTVSKKRFLKRSEARPIDRQNSVFDACKTNKKEIDRALPIYFEEAKRYAKIFLNDV